MKYIEGVLLTAFAVGIILRMFLIEVNTILVLFSLTLLSFFYFGFGILIFNNIGIRDVLNKKPFNNIAKFRILGSILFGVNISILVIGVLFVLLHWPGYQLMLVLGLIPAIIALTIIIIKTFNQPQKAYKIVVPRLLIFLTLSVTLWLNPIFFDEICFRNHPKELALIKAKHAYENDPSEVNLQQLEKARADLRTVK